MIKKKIVSPAALKKILKTKKRKVSVFTNGVFDILHAGHATYLENARKLGDLLIVALNTDASTSRLKGPSRPINPLEDRAKVIAALESVDYVTWFDDDTPLKLIESLTPRLLVKGGDYEPRKIVGYDHVVKNGGKVKVIKFLEGRSTTGIIERVQRNR
ncbi:MAG: D-glycero-beta-D-manno-heptose 1-phosphate adenylyltransferase [Bdellovibrionales bacterium]|nr:D-glycero-beta-D-manno-heptose 1-phosphate adenylyltransferase [Bdellovibrionales bacterium]